MFGRRLYQRDVRLEIHSQGAEFSRKRPRPQQNFHSQDICHLHKQTLCKE